MPAAWTEADEARLAVLEREVGARPAWTEQDEARLAALEAEIGGAPAATDPYAALRAAEQIEGRAPTPSIGTPPTETVAPETVGVARQLISRPAKSFLETLGGALSGFGLIQREKTQAQDEGIEAAKEKAFIDATAKPLPEGGRVALVREPYTGKLVRRRVDSAGAPLTPTEVRPDERDSFVADLASVGGVAAGAALKQAASGIKTSPEMDRSFWLGDVPSALGSAAAFGAISVTAGPMATGLAGTSLQMDSAYETVTRRAEELRAEGKEEEAINVEGKRFEQMLMQAPVGALEIAGAGQYLNGFLLVLRGAPLESRFLQRDESFVHARVVRFRAYSVGQ